MDRRGKYAENYMSIVQLKRIITNKIKRNGKIVVKVIDNLIKQNFLQTKKSGQVISIVYKRKHEILRILKVLD